MPSRQPVASARLPSQRALPELRDLRAAAAEAERLRVIANDVSGFIAATAVSPRRTRTRSRSTYNDPPQRQREALSPRRGPSLRTVAKRAYAEHEKAEERRRAYAEYEAQRGGMRPSSCSRSRRNMSISSRTAAPSRIPSAQRSPSRSAAPSCGATTRSRWSPPASGCAGRCEDVQSRWTHARAEEYVWWVWWVVASVV